MPVQGFKRWQEVTHLNCSFRKVKQFSGFIDEAIVVRVEFSIHLRMKKSSYWMSLVFIFQLQLTWHTPLIRMQMFAESLSLVYWLIQLIVQIYLLLELKYVCLSPYFSVCMSVFPWTSSFSSYRAIKWTDD